MNANDLWFTARGAGLSALLTLSVATACGAFGSLATAAPATRVVVQYLHRTAAALGIGLIAVHVSTIVLDSKSHIGVAGALVPFASHYRPNAVALGSCTAYLVLIVAALGLARGRLAANPAGARIWRAAHSVGYLLWAAAVLHGLLAGTDRGQGWVLMLIIGCVLLVLAAGTVRLITLDDQPEVHAGPRLSDRPIGSSRRPAGTGGRSAAGQPRNVLR